MQDEHSRFLIKGSIWQTLSQIFTKFVSFVYLLLLTRLVSQQIIGEFYLVLSIIGLFTIISDFGLPNTVTRYVPYFYGKKMFGELESLVKLALIVGSLSSLFVVFIIYWQAAPLSSFFNNQNIAGLLSLMSFFVLLSFLFSILQSLLISRGAVRENVLVNNLQNTLKLVLTLIFFYFYGFNTTSLALAFLLSYAIAVVYASILFSRLWGVIPKSNAVTMKSTELLKDILPFGLTVTAAVVFSSISSSVDRLMLGYFLDPSIASEIIAVYTVALPLAIFVSLFSSSLTVAFLPRISELIGKGDKNFKQIRQLTHFVTKWSIISMISILIFIFTFSKDILRVLYGASYQGGYLVFIILSLAYFLLYISHAPRLVLASMRLVKLELKMVVLSGLLNLILNLLLIPKFGAEGAAVATAFSFLTMTLITQHYSRLLFSFSLNKDIYKIIIAGLIPLVFLFFAHDYFISFILSKPLNLDILANVFFRLYEIVILSIPFLISAAAYLLILMFLRVFDENDFDIFKSALLRLRVPQKFTDSLDRFVLLKQDREIH